MAGEGKQAKCIEALNMLNVPLDEKRDAAAGALRANSYSFSNEVIGLALRTRRSSVSDGTGGDGDE